VEQSLPAAGGVPALPIGVDLRSSAVSFSRRPLLESPFEKTPDFRHCIMVKPKRTRLFIKPYCGWCRKAIQWLDDHEVQYEQVNVIADEAAFDEMIRLSGQELVPVLDVDGEILADFGPDQLAEFWSKLEKKHGSAASR
jgi:glutaredoxin